MQRNFQNNEEHVVDCFYVWVYVADSAMIWKWLRRIFAIRMSEGTTNLRDAKKLSNDVYILVQVKCKHDATKMSPHVPLSWLVLLLRRYYYLKLPGFCPSFLFMLKNVVTFSLYFQLEITQFENLKYFILNIF